MSRCFKWPAHILQKSSINQVKTIWQAVTSLFLSLCIHLQYRPKCKSSAFENNFKSVMELFTRYMKNSYYESVTDYSFEIRMNSSFKLLQTWKSHWDWALHNHNMTVMGLSRQKIKKRTEITGTKVIELLCILVLTIQLNSSVETETKPLPIVYCSLHFNRVKQYQSSSKP